MKLILVEKKDRCSTIANRKYGKKTGLYKSMGISKCRHGKIWKGIKSENVGEQDEETCHECAIEEMEALEEIEEGNPTLEDGTPVCEGCLEELLSSLNENIIEEAKYQGRTVTLNKPQRGGSKKFFVYVRDPKTKNVKKVSFGDPNMKIKKSNPARRKSFRARHKCSQKKDKTTSGYWACKSW